MKPWTGEESKCGECKKTFNVKDTVRTKIDPTWYCPEDGQVFCGIQCFELHCSKGISTVSTETLENINTQGFFWC